MKDKLSKKKRPRLKWYNFILDDPELNQEYLRWKINHKYKIRSENKLSYIFLRSVKGLDWISNQRKWFSDIQETIRIGKTKWVDED